MLKHLKYIDDKSDKFWQIEVAGNSYTITFGRSGTSGQVKIKTFDTGEACLTEAGKLVNEKIKKGYSENGTANEIISVKAKSAVQSSVKETLAKELKDLILETDFNGLLPFLEKYAKEHMELLRKEIKASQYQYNTSDKRDLISLAALAVFNLSDTRNWDQLAETLRSNIPQLKEVLDWAKPTWLAEYLLRQLTRGDRLYFDYGHLRKLEETGHLFFHPELYARFISTYYNGIDFICTDEVAYTRDVPLLFECETSLYTTRIYRASANAPSYKKITFLWDVAFERLLEEGKIEKEFILTRVLEMQTKHWHNHLKAFFRKLLVRVGLEKEMVIRNQEFFFPLLHSEQSVIANFAIDSLKLYFAEKDLNLAEFLNWAGPAFMRSDLKGGVKSLLIQLDNTIAKKSELKDKICNLVADVFMIPDLQLQERAANFLLKHGKDSEIGEKLAMYSSQMLGTVVNDLKTFVSPDTLGEESAVAPDDEEEYTFDPVPVKKLAEEIAYPETWNDILFHMGKIIKTHNIVDIDILLQCWLCKRDMFPDDYKQQFEPYFIKMRGARSEFWYQHFYWEFIIFLRNGDRVYEEERFYGRYPSTVLTSSDMVILAQKRILDKIFLPLLSVPTHQPFWVDPVVLTERIIAYEKAAQEIDLTDFAVALSRMPRENTEKATRKLQEVQDEEIKALLNFALGNTNAVQKGKDRGWAGLWALVVRTHQPDAVFNELLTSFGDVPFMAEPFRPGLQMKSDYWGEYNYRLNVREQTEYLGDILDITFPTQPNVPDTFIYGKDIYMREGGKNPSINRSDVTYMYSLMSQNTEALALFLVMIFNKKGESDYKETSILLNHMLNGFYIFDPASNIYLATSIFNKLKETRSMACEVLIRSIDENRLPTEDIGSKLGILIQRHYAPVIRMLGIFESVKDVSHKHNDALFKLLESLLPEIKPSDNMPINVKKVLEFYYDLKFKLNRSLSPKVEISLNALAGLKALQPIINKIKK